MNYENDSQVMHVIRQVRLMNRYFAATDVEPYREHYAELHCTYMEMLHEEIAPHALELAQAIVEWEEWAMERRKSQPVATTTTRRRRKVKIADAVTRQHAETFVEVFLDSALDSEAPSDAFAKTALLEWPEDNDAQERYHAIADEIRERTFAAAKHAIVEAFFVAATEVLDRERRR